MRILLIGGTGLISSQVSDLALAEGHDVTLVNRGRSLLPSAQGAHIIHADATDPESLRAALRGPRLRGERFDAVVQFVAYEPHQVLDDIETFRRLTDRYVLIATAAAYRKYDHLRPLTEDVPLENPYWEYARKKIACEEALRTSSDIPWTIIRPAHTYGASKIPGFTGVSRHPWTLVDRMRRGADIILPGDGTSLWTITHARDVAAGIVGLLSTPDAVGHAVHVTGSEALTWRGIHEAIGKAAGVPVEQLREQFVCVPSDALVGAAPSQAGSIYGDKMHPAVYDTSKLRALVPAWEQRVPFADGVAEAVAFFEAHAELRTIDDDANAMFDALGARYRAALHA
ncbi:NAD-dependent epimerase/dehydratase family protein [Demequina sp.]|uniref:NAD-dependent epimerase/dehydratase family protein n=1 Tax=Demequina sp. TaxID=2050685 RepID=UPI003D129F2D